MKYLGHYLIHHKGWMDVALELSQILDEQNIAREFRYTVSNEITVPQTIVPLRSTTVLDVVPAGEIIYQNIACKNVNRVDGMDFYRSLEQAVMSTTHGLSAYFTWELAPAGGHTLTQWDKSASKIYDISPPRREYWTS